MSNEYLTRRPLVLGFAKIIFLALCQIPLIQAIPIHASQLIWTREEAEPKPADDPSLWLYLTVAAALVLLGGAFAGLTIALMGQDEIYLQVIRDSGEGKEKEHARKVLNLLKRGKHWVLVTLLLSNVITNETLPIVLDRSLGGGWPAVLGSTVLIVIFGEIVPQSVCVRFGLPIGAWMSPFVLGLMWIMAPVAWPTAKLLDYLLGKDHGTVYKKAGLKTLVSLHRNMGETNQRLHADEVTIISAVLDLKEKTVGSIMTPMDDVFTLSLDDVLNEETMHDILSQGYSRIPVHHPDNDENFVGMLLVKMLITYDPEDAKPVRDFSLATLPETKPDTSCLDIVNFFQEGKSHMVLVSNHPGEDHGAIGVVTLEDVIEELIGEEIVDESDVFVDIHKAIRRMTPTPWNRFPRAQDKASTQIKFGSVGGPDLLDISEGQTLDVNGLKRANTTDFAQRTSIVQPRRLSGNSALGESKVVKRGASTNELREHLKHLGPSNLASKPKTTRYSAVKIKPGTDADGPSKKNDSFERSTAMNRRVSQAESEYTGGIGEGLLTGGKGASDGVQALSQGYGTISSSPSIKRPISSHKSVQADLEDADDKSTSNQTLEARPPARTMESDDYIGELRPSESRPRSRSPFYKHSGPARSGSITENIVDTNGIRKVVLETTSSSESLHEISSNQEAASSSGKPNTQHQDGHTVSKKKKKKHHKRKGKGGESEPLLSSK